MMKEINGYIGGETYVEYDEAGLRFYVSGQKVITLNTEQADRLFAEMAKRQPAAEGELLYDGKIEVSIGGKVYARI